MVISIDKPNIQDLQVDVIELLEQISNLFDRARKALSSDGSGEKYGTFQQEVNDAAINVKDLELRMAVIAPMKAGKSTIINAIVGQDLLPSRNAAMTTLPTEIVFNTYIKQPILTLSDEILSVYRDTHDRLSKEIQLLEQQEQLQDKIAQYPHLIDLIEEIKQEVSFLARSQTYGCEEITKVLKYLNDIVRLCSVLEPSLDPIPKLIEVPRLETPFWHSQEAEQSSKLGNLVIIDTPGPNEAGENLRLTAVVAEQLRRSSIVLIVLDFTQLNNKAAEEVKKQVQPIIDLLGKENLYVLINKVDQRRKEDMTPEQVKEFVFADLNLSNSSHTNRVFEIAARRAFVAAKFMLELQQCSQIDLTEKATVMSTAEALAPEVFGIDWEDDLEEATVEDLKKKAERLWAKSGFAPFLKQAIDALMESAAPRCMLSALNLSRNRLLELRDDVKLRSSAIAQDEKKLRLEISALEADLHRLDLCRNQFKKVDNIRLSLQNELNETITLLKKEAQVSIEDYFVEKDWEQADWLKKINIKTREIFSTNIANFEIFSERLSENIKSQLEYKSSGIAEFDNEQKAEEFADRAIIWAKQRSENLLIGFRKHTEIKIIKAQTDLIDFLERETRPIIEQARQRLKQNFDVELSPPPLNLEKISNVDYIQPQIGKQAREIVDSKTVKHRPWYFLWLVETQKQVQVTRTESYYTVSLQDLVNQINKSIEKNVEVINQALDSYLEEDFKQRIDNYFLVLDTYLSNYRNNLRQAQQDRQLTFEEKKHLIDELNNFVPEVTAQIKKVDSYLDRTKNLNDYLL